MADLTRRLVVCVERMLPYVRAHGRHRAMYSAVNGASGDPELKQIIETVRRAELVLGELRGADLKKAMRGLGPLKRETRENP